MLLVESTFSDCIQEICRYVKSMKSAKTSILKGLSDDTCSRTDIKAYGTPIDSHTSILRIFDNLVNNMVWLCEIDNSRPLIVAFRSEPGIPRRHVFLLWQMPVELIDDKLALLRGSFVSLAFIVRADIPDLLLEVFCVYFALFEFRHLNLFFSL